MNFKVDVFSKYDTKDCILNYSDTVQLTYANVNMKFINEV